VSFWVAYLYCMWDGDGTTSRLPTEAEWNAAAAGGDQQRAYPWSSPDYASREIEGRAEYKLGDRLPFAVGASLRGAGRWGTQDLAGNVWEWVRDVGAEAVSASGMFRYIDDPSDPVDLTGEVLDPETPHVLRGGSFKDFGCTECEPQARLRTPVREVLRPYNAYNDVGFRCARSYR
jgi:sulfatase modifying factor 1